MPRRPLPGMWRDWGDSSAGPAQDRASALSDQTPQATRPGCSALRNDPTLCLRALQDLVREHPSGGAARPARPAVAAQQQGSCCTGMASASAPNRSGSTGPGLARCLPAGAQHADTIPAPLALAPLCQVSARPVATGLALVMRRSHEGRGGSRCAHATGSQGRTSLPSENQETARHSLMNDRP